MIACYRTGGQTLAGAGSGKALTRRYRYVVLRAVTEVVPYSPCAGVPGDREWRSCGLSGVCEDAGGSCGDGAARQLAVAMAAAGVYPSLLNEIAARAQDNVGQRAVRDSKRGTESPRAEVSVFCCQTIVPRIEIRVGDSLIELVSQDAHHCVGADVAVRTRCRLLHATRAPAELDYRPTRL